MMNSFEKWPTLHQLLKEGSLSFIDLAFAECVLKGLKSAEESHAALLSCLFALSRQGHLILDLDHLEESLAPLDIPDCAPLSSLLCLGAKHFPKEGIATPTSSENTPSAWICRYGSYLYLQKNWVYESEILTHLQRLNTYPPALCLSPGPLNAQLNPMQQEAVKKALCHSLSLLTGGPGTGKTFTAAEIVTTCLASLPDKPYTILLTAPTGKAVAQLEANLKQATFGKATLRSGTLHAILELRPHIYEKNTRPLLADLIIVDECSMIDANIFSKLLASIPSGARVVLIGDKDQLPPIEAGSIFADLIEIPTLPSTQLTQSLRSDRTEILSLARFVQEGKADAAIELLSSKTAVEWIDLNKQENPINSYSYLWNRYKDCFPSHFLHKPTPEQLLDQLGSFSILSCMRHGALGVESINAYFLCQTLSQAQTGTFWTAPIIITKNDPDLGLFNGDLGVIVRKITPDFSTKTLSEHDIALFRDRRGGYRQIAALALNAFEYNYALSVHKSQGSEYDQVLILMPKGSDCFGKEVIYTALTRARHKVALAGCQDILRASMAKSSRKKSGIQARAKALSNEPKSANLSRK